MVVHYDTVNEARLADKDTALLYVALAESAKAAPAVGQAIDKVFANSSNETRTQSEGDLFASQIQRVADIDLVVGGIVSAVFFALLLATGALMMQSIRERVPELAVLKTLGFSDKLVMCAHPGGSGDLLRVLRGSRAWPGLGDSAGGALDDRHQLDADGRDRQRSRVRRRPGAHRWLRAGLARPASAGRRSTGRALISMAATTAALRLSRPAIESF